ncbi:hypothetical protein KC19_VG025200 [Ceratodon purpureus]|uniref:Uncharacterized protein n=1 Tax=Ceratodon purpureus TaxID=3225 RepID=A0A8T0HLH9_CERPU|nr:hypothetical protein KC19_VG025200 [Ceratodon purpureus]
MRVMNGTAFNTFSCQIMELYLIPPFLHFIDFAHSQHYKTKLTQWIFLKFPIFGPTCNGPENLLTASIKNLHP